MKKATIYLLLIISILLLTGCKKDKDKDPEDMVPDSQDITITPAATLVPTQALEDNPSEPEVNHDGEIRSSLTGLWVPEEIGRKRPYAIQFSNFKTVRNQWGIGQADIVYEALVEGGITRLLAIGENYTGDRLGSVRSSRHYFVSIADEYDAIYIHYGKTKYAKAKIAESKINNLDGETGIGTTVFYRDKSMNAPHNAFTSLDRILKGIKQKGYKTEHDENFKPHYSFYKEDTDVTTGVTASRVDIKFSGYNTPYLEYNAEDKLYYRYQFGEVHKDSNTGDQLAFKNIIIQLVKEWDIDRNDYQTMDLEDASGKGYYITNGKLVDITWKKKEADRFMRYYDASGQELTINPGKTYIALFPRDQTDKVIVK